MRVIGACWQNDKPHGIGLNLAFRPMPITDDLIGACRSKQNACTPERVEAELIALAARKRRTGWDDNMIQEAVVLTWCAIQFGLVHDDAYNGWVTVTEKGSGLVMSEVTPRFEAEPGIGPSLTSMQFESQARAAYRICKLAHPDDEVIVLLLVRFSEFYGLFVKHYPLAANLSPDAIAFVPIDRPRFAGIIRAIEAEKGMSLNQPDSPANLPPPPTGCFWVLTITDGQGQTLLPVNIVP